MRFPDEVVWTPTPEYVKSSRLTESMRLFGTRSYEEFHQLSIEEPNLFWRIVLAQFEVRWRRSFEKFCDLDAGKAFPKWFVGGEINFVDTVLRLAEDPKTASATAIVDEDEEGNVTSCSYGALAKQVAAFAGSLKALGINQRDAIGLMMPLGREAIVSFLAISSIGAIAVPLFTGFGPEAIVSRLGLAGAKALITTDGMRRRGRKISIDAHLPAIAARVPTLTWVIRKLALGLDRPMLRTEVLDWDELVNRGVSLTPQPLDPNHPFMLVFTSGTTGLPKGTVHIHGGFPLKIIQDTAHHFDLRMGAVWLWPTDMGWVVGPISVIGVLSHGGTLVCYNGAPDFPDWDRLSKLIARHKVSHFGASPTLIRGFATAENAATSGNMNSIRLLMSAGEVLDPPHFRWFAEKFGDRARKPVINYTGGTEVSGALLANILLRPIKLSGFNAVSPGVDVGILHESGVDPNQPGELIVRGPFVGMTQSFWGDNNRYLEAYWSRAPGVWCHGDLAYADAEGHFFIIGRSDDTLKVAGKRVGPAEVEALVMTLPEVSEAAAVGLPDSLKGEVLVICVVAKAGASLGRLEARISDKVESELGKPFKPAKVHIVDELPKTRNAKVMRRVIRRTLAGEEPGDLSALENPTAVDKLKLLSHFR